MTLARWVAAVGLATIAVVRCVLLFAPTVVFDIDPAVNPFPIGGLGPAGSMRLDCGVLLLGALGLLAEARSGRGVRSGLLVLAFVPIPIVLLHGLSDAGDLWIGTTWAAGVIGAVTLAHLARERSIRIVTAALLAAALAPLLVRGIANVTYEHAATIAAFEEHSAAVLADRGWQPGSAQALIFERRLRERAPTAWFLTPNIFASCMAFGLVLGAALLLGVLRGASARRGARLVAIGMVTLAGGGLVLAGSKGALVAGLFGVLVVVLLGASGKLCGLARRVAGALAVGVLALTLLAVVARGAALPEGFAGDRSLLFRFHYLVGAVRVVSAHPWTGVGPDHFQDAYVQHRVPRSPEEVRSAHSMFADWIATLGVPAIAWVTLILVLVAGGATRVARLAAASSRPPPMRLVTRAAPAGVVALGLLGAVLCELHSLNDLALFVRLAGVVAFFGAALALSGVLELVDDGLRGFAWLAATLVLLMHGQIEMTFTQPGSAVWALAVVGMAASLDPGDGPRGRRVPRWSGVLAAALAIVVALLVFVRGVQPAARQQELMVAAAAGLAVPPAPSVERTRAAVRLLRLAHLASPTAPLPRFHAANELVKAARRAPEPLRIELLRAALDDLDAVGTHGFDGGATGLAVSIHRELSRLTGDPAELDRALLLARELVARDPHGLRTNRLLADVLWERGARDEAARAYRRVLEIDAAFALDPLKQLGERERAEVAERAAPP